MVGFLALSSFRRDGNRVSWNCPNLSLPKKQCEGKKNNPKISRKFSGYAIRKMAD
jgi:hypothetical protein